MEEKTEKKVCKSVDYINQTARNLSEINEEILEEFLRSIRQSRRIILGAEGRSRSALLIGIKGIKKRTFTITDSSFHWRNLKEAAIDLEKKRGTTILLINSGSGETSTPKQLTEDLRGYIEEAGSKKFLICTVTSKSESSIARMSDTVLKMRGRGDDKGRAVNQLDFGIMGDIYELATTLLFHNIKKAINNGFNADKVLKASQKEIKIIGASIDRYLSSSHYQKLVEETSSRARIIFGGLGPAREVAEMTALRTMHIKSVVGESAYLAGSFAPPPKPGDVLVLISFSGETGPTLKWCSDYKAAGGIVFSIVGRESTLSKASQSYVLGSSVEEFYQKVVFLLSPLPGGIMEKFRQCGIRIPEEIIRILGHSKTE